MKQLVKFLALVNCIIILSFAFIGCANTQSNIKPISSDKIALAYVHDWAEPKVPSGAVRIAVEQQEKAIEQETAETEAEEEYYEEEYYDYGYSGGYVGYRGDPDGLNNFNGVYEYEGRTESFYSGQAVYTNDLTVDEDGFYRDDEGRYAVATSSGDYSIGDTFEGSMGTCVVVDDGASPGVTDYYVNGWY